MAPHNRNYDEYDYEGGDTWADGFHAGKVTERKSHVYQDYRPRYTARSNAPAWTMSIIMLIGVIVFAVWLAPDLLHTTSALAPSGAVGNQAPPAAVRRAPPASAPAQAAPALPGVAQNAAEAQAQYDALVQAGEHAQATPAPLPLNSAGEPIIDAAQQQQLNQSLQLAEQEGAAAADQQLAAQRATANADAQSRAPDVSKADAEQMMHRDLCSVPRANPATCGQGLYKPTPVQ